MSIAERFTHQGNEQLGRGEYLPALTSYLSAIGTDPNYVQGWNSIATLCIRLNTYLLIIYSRYLINWNHLRM